jgi:hypothetical protein
LDEVFWGLRADRVIILPDSSKSSFMESSGTHQFSTLQEKEWGRKALCESPSVVTKYLKEGQVCFGL